jgi:DNA-binding winged helix-turn-helix (wHTH) protein
MGTGHCTAYRFGSFVLDLERGALLAAAGEELPLRPKSFDLLRFLVEHAGRLKSQEAIMEALWPNVFVTENSVAQCVREIRYALGPDGCRMLRTVPRRGYLFMSEVVAAPVAIEVVTLSYGRREASMAPANSNWRGGFAPGARPTGAVARASLGQYGAH